MEGDVETEGSVEMEGVLGMLRQRALTRCRGEIRGGREVRMRPGCQGLDDLPYLSPFLCQDAQPRRAPPGTDDSPPSRLAAAIPDEHPPVPTTVLPAV